MEKKIVVLFSGSGTNLKNLIEKIHKKEFNGVKIVISKTITNNPTAGGIQFSKEANIPCVIINHKDFASREEFDKVLVNEIEKEKPDLVVLAGFMRILTKVFTDKIKNAINLHPSLLPLFKGTNAIKRSFDSDMKVGGVTIHWVNEELDGGKIIEQECIKKANDYETFYKQIRKLEYDLLPRVVKRLLTE